MRIVRDLKDIRSNFETCQREAKAAFGRDEVFVEEFWENMKVSSVGGFSEMNMKVGGVTISGVGIIF